ncbi:hypothetical protein HY639_02575 [Candidatus Woesearchaeota archaeon]|nr:hypothetical protein [Candidatus Woesearchaeota archaeon]
MSKHPGGLEFIGCELYTIVQRVLGMGGMSEDSSTSYALCKAGELDIRLKSGYLLRENAAATASLVQQKETQCLLGEKARNARELKRLEGERASLEKKIAYLKK